MTNENPSAWGVLSDAERALVADAARLSGAATEGPWLLDGPWWHGRDEAVPLVVTTDRRAIVIEPPASEAAAGANVEFVAWSRAGVPALLALVDRLAADLSHMDEVAEMSAAAYEHAAAERDAARTTAALLEADGARLRERIEELIVDLGAEGDTDLDRDFGAGLGHAAWRLDALLAPEDDAPAAAQCECMTDSTALRALLAEGGEGGE